MRRLLPSVAQRVKTQEKEERERREKKLNTCESRAILSTGYLSCGSRFLVYIFIASGLLGRPRIVLC